MTITLDSQRHPLVVTATGALNGVTTPRSVTANVHVLATGATTFAGLVLDEEDKPVKGALVKIGTVPSACPLGDSGSTRHLFFLSTLRLLCADRDYFLIEA